MNGPGDPARMQMDRTDLKTKRKGKEKRCFNPDS